ncbi:hypothetical protein [Nonomuraea pusilla]|nr:hypothetical protein [Nonomuraea pusilla]
MGMALILIFIVAVAPGGGLAAALLAWVGRVALGLPGGVGLWCLTWVPAWFIGCLAWWVAVLIDLENDVPRMGSAFAWQGAATVLVVALALTIRKTAQP